MKTLPALFVIAAAFFACQQKQYFVEAPEIDLIKKCNDTYVNGDWAALRAFYHDTATIYVNTWSRGKLTPDEVIGQFRNDVANYSAYGLAEDGIYEMVVTPDGQHWVHNWTEWKGTHKNGKEVRSVVNISWRVENNKVVFAGFIFDRLPGHLAAQMDSVASL